MPATASAWTPAILPPSVGAEPDPNGGRLDLGAFGGIADASLSPGLRVARLASVSGGQVLRGARRITWTTQGPWALGDTVALQYSPDGGITWLSIPGADAVAFQQGYFDWNVAPLTPGSNYLLQVSRNGGGGGTVASGAFRIIAPGAATFYVNDFNPTNDVYCTAIGNDANDGISPANPEGDAQAVVGGFHAGARRPGQD